jgi:hypothetical protein
MNKKINLDANDYYTQRNNQIKPSVACMPTARVMFYIGNKIKYNNPSKYQDDDFFMSLLLSDAAKEFAQKKYPNLVNAGYAPNEIHGMYNSWLDEIVTGKRVSDFKLDLTFDDYIDRIKTGQVIMTSGQFGNFSGHAVVIIGVVHPTKTPLLVLADPYGDYRETYLKGSGYAVTMTKEDFIDHVKPVGKFSKWGHVII